MSAAGILLGLNHNWRNRSDQHGFRHPLRSVTADVTREFAAAGLVAHVNRVLEIKRCRQFREVIGVCIQIVSIPRLTRSTVSAAIMRDAAITALRQKEHLVFEGVGTQRPAVAEDHRLPLAPVFVVNLRSVFCRNRTHTNLLELC